ncbi:MAG: sugar phosphate isomerase/epimerase [Clostridia bacterium]|nr:sugar phosphate isomerase/epimerase [Clostridia bacterium]
MKFGAQFYTLRKRATTPAELEICFAEMHKIGYEVAQMSGICKMDPYELRDMSQKYELPITVTHSPLDRILNDTKALIEEHKIYGCPVIGLGSMPNENRTVEGTREFLKMIERPMKEINDAGLAFAYHNHSFEFDNNGGTDIYDILVEEAPELNFIMDTYWFRHGERDIMKYIKELGGKRMTNIHFKDMKNDPKGPICPCGEGVIDFKPIIELCDKVGVKYALVEQDNAPDLGDEFAQMKTSFVNTFPLFK